MDTIINLLITIQNKVNYVTGFVTGWVPLVEHELLTLPEHVSSPLLIFKDPCN